ncbi:ATP-sensitive inward rectifier potassium channel 10 [filamentous cyanobacterium LEGE 11480]|uniref:ATP-sensitive inward rectifier potassium channel 10 n=2 Tax=Romeriopsis TaxID=2992131 RepID=A0A928VKG5_9CYAN|nr:ATP-sensitive inward rectifier potassium channel 10 [Romeriopsis navalis LEGE 11480]
MPRRPKSTNTKVRIRNQDGRLQFQGGDHWRDYLRDPYHLMLTIPWPGFVGLVAVAYIVVNALFACLYLLQPGSLKGSDGSFAEAFFFSVQTLASIGYGAIYPQTTYAGILMTIEAILSLLAIAVITGLAFARFAKPTARIMFSRYAVVAPYNGMPTLMFRAANQRQNLILEAQAKVYLARDEITQEGVPFRRIYDLNLVREVNPRFSLTWNVMHPIDRTSPLYGLTAEQWETSFSQILVTLMGLDETVAYDIHVRHVYGLMDVLWNHRLANVMQWTESGDRYIEYAKFDAVEPIDPKA